MNKVIVTGTRDEGARAYKATIESLLEEYNPTVVVTGGAKGVDTIAADWAEANGKVLCVYGYITELRFQGGPARNRYMVKGNQDAEVVLAFPMGASKGTRNCIKVAEDYGLAVLVTELGGSK